MTPLIDMKRCCTCKQTKEIDAFHKNKKSCKVCRIVERKKSYDKRKVEDYKGMLTYNLTWFKNNPEKVYLSSKKWRQTHKDTARLHCNKRYSRAKQARVKWANKFFIEEIYRLAALRTKTTGIQWHVDHIIPLRNPLVCGLHVENNLQVIPAKVNQLKGNKLGY